jgi:hypothetical protein
MPQVTLARAGQISDPIEVGPGTRIVSTNGYVQWTVGTLTDVRNGIAVWQTWPSGAAAGTQDTLRRVVIRGVATGAMVLTWDESRQDEGPDGAYWQEQVPAFAFDGFGNKSLDAIVQHRTGTKAQITAIVDAPVGEVAAPTDQNILMVRREGSWVDIGASAGAGLLLDAGTTPGAVILNVPDSSSWVHIKITPGVVQDIDAVLPAAPALGRTIVLTVDGYLPTSKTVAIKFLGSTLTTFTPAERVTLTYMAAEWDGDSSPVSYMWSVNREQVAFWGDPNVFGALSLSDISSSAVAGGVAKQGTAFASGFNALANGQNSVAVGSGARSGPVDPYSGSGGYGAVALGSTVSGAGTAVGAIVSAFDYSMAIGTPNTENARASYYKIGRDHARADFALWRNTALSANAELSLNGANPTNSAAGGPRFLFVRVGLYVLDMVCTARVIGTSKAYLLSKRVLVLNDATAGALLVGSQALGTAINSGLATNITTDPFIVTVDAATKTLRVNFTPNAFSDGNMTVQAGVSAFMAIAA